MKVLIAEDEPVSRRLLESFLRKLDYDVLVTCDGSEAWDVLQKPDAPNLVISDWMMPNMDGITLIKKLKSQLATRYIPIIMLTAKDQEDAEVEVMDAGADDYLVKPDNPKGFLAGINRLLKRPSIAEI